MGHLKSNILIITLSVFPSKISSSLSVKPPLCHTNFCSCHQSTSVSLRFGAFFISLFLSYLFLYIFTVTFLTQTFLSLWLNYHLSWVSLFSFVISPMLITRLVFPKLCFHSVAAMHPESCLLSNQGCSSAWFSLPSPVHTLLPISFYFPLLGSTHPNF